VREYGTMGQCQAWKSFRDYRGKFTVYQESAANFKGFNDIGPLKRHKKISE